MFKLFFSCLAIVLSNDIYAQTENSNSLNNASVVISTKKLPSDVQKIIKKAQHCYYLSGEFNGDGSERDKDINKLLMRNKCVDISKKLHTLKIKYKRQRDVLISLEAVKLE